MSYGSEILSLAQKSEQSLPSMKKTFGDSNNQSYAMCWDKQGEKYSLSILIDTFELIERQWAGHSASIHKYSSIDPWCEALDERLTHEYLHN